MSVSEAQSLQRPALLHRCDLNLASKPKLPFVTVGDNMPAGTGSKQHYSFGLLSPWFNLNCWQSDLDIFLNRTDLMQESFNGEQVQSIKLAF